MYHSNSDDMTEQFEQAKRELAERWCLKVIECMKEDDYIIHAPDEFLSDLTALLEQHKEMMLREELIKYDEWVFENGKAFADTKESVDEYIEYLKNVKK